MLRSALASLVACCLTGQSLTAQRPGEPPAITMEGEGAVTFVLISGMVGGTAGFDQLASRLVANGYRVLRIDPYQLSLDSTDVSFAAMARRVDAPTLILAGSEDALAGAANAERLAALIPGARVEVIAGSGHTPQVERPAAVTRLLAPFLEPVTRLLAPFLEP